MKISHRRWPLAALALASLSNVAWPQSAPSPYTIGFRFDAAQRLVGKIAPDPDGAGPLRYGATRNTYDARGVLTRVEVGELATWQSEAVRPEDWTGFTVFRHTDYRYDVNGRKLSEQVSAGSAAFLLTQFSYDNIGRLDCTARRMNVASFNLALSACTPGTPGSFGADRIERVGSYDNSDRPLSIVRAYGTALQQNYATYTYSGAHLASSTDANGNVSTFHVDGLGRLEFWRFPSPTNVGQTRGTDFEKYSYDANGNRTQLKKRDGSVIDYAYDGLDRMTSKDLPGSAADVSYSYDLRGLQLTARFSATGAGITNAFDGFGRLVESTSTMGGLTRSLYNAYDGNGNRTRVTHPDGMYFDYAYDGRDRLTHICENPTQTCTSTASPVISLSYDSPGRRQQLTRGASVSVSGYGYDLISRLSSLGHDLDGSSTGNDVSTSFGVNPASQIVSRTVSNSAYEDSVVSPNRGYTVNGLNQYTQITSPGAAILTHDANGNLTSDGASTFTYDTENRLTGASGAKNATLAYDPMGRLFQTSGSTTTQFLYNGDSMVAEYDAGGSLKRRYVSGPGLDEPLVWYEGAGVSSANRRYLHADHQGSIIAVANSAGATLERETYDVYGIQGGANSSRFQYTGQANIPELGLYYYKARMYSPVLGRFMQTDPIGYDDNVNLYAYVGNDPLNQFDPFGEHSFVVARPLDSKLGIIGVGHAYSVSHADYIGDPNATIHSQGKLANGNMGNVGDSSKAAEISKPTAASDAKHWKSLNAGTSKNIAKIDAPDDVVAAVAKAVSENRPYALVPHQAEQSPTIGTILMGVAVPVPTPEVNSNSGAFAIGDKAAEMSGGAPVDRSTFSLILPGQAASGKIELECTPDVKSAGDC